MTLEDNIAEFVTYIKEMNNLEQNVSSGIEGFNTAQSKKVIDFVHQGWDSVFIHMNNFDDIKFQVKMIIFSNVMRLIDLKFNLCQYG